MNSSSMACRSIGVSVMFMAQPFHSSKDAIIIIVAFAPLDRSLVVVVVISLIGNNIVVHVHIARIRKALV